MPNAFDLTITDHEFWLIKEAMRSYVEEWTGSQAADDMRRLLREWVGNNFMDREPEPEPEPGTLCRDGVVP